MLREFELTRLLTAIDTAVSRAIDAYNVASETGDDELAEQARACVEQLRAFRELAAAQPTRASRWMHARPPRGEALHPS